MGGVNPIVDSGTESVSVPNTTTISTKSVTFNHELPSIPKIYTNNDQTASTSGIDAKWCASCAKDVTTTGFTLNVHQGSTNAAKTVVVDWIAVIE